MSEHSSIEWTDATWNPVRGCTRITPGCDHCYAETFAERFRGVPNHPYEQGFDLRLVPVLSSSGVSALLIGARRLGPERRLVLARPCEMVRRVCELTGLNRFVVLRDQVSPGLEARSEWADNR